MGGGSRDNGNNTDENREGKHSSKESKALNPFCLKRDVYNPERKGSYSYRLFSTGDHLGANCVADLKSHLYILQKKKKRRSNLLREVDLIKCRGHFGKSLGRRASTERPISQSYIEKGAEESVGKGGGSGKGEMGVDRENQLTRVTCPKSSKLQRGWGTTRLKPSPAKKD